MTDVLKANFPSYIDTLKLRVQAYCPGCGQFTCLLCKMPIDEDMWYPVSPSQERHRDKLRMPPHREYNHSDRPYLHCRELQASTFASRVDVAVKLTLQGLIIGMGMILIDRTYHQSEEGRPIVPRLATGKRARSVSIKVKGKWVGTSERQLPGPTGSLHFPIIVPSPPRGIARFNRFDPLKALSDEPKLQADPVVSNIGYFARGHK